MYVCKDKKLFGDAKLIYGTTFKMLFAIAVDNIFDVSIQKYHNYYCNCRYLSKIILYNLHQTPPPHLPTPSPIPPPPPPMVECPYISQIVIIFIIIQTVVLESARKEFSYTVPCRATCSLTVSAEVHANNNFYTKSNTATITTPQIGT